jgi:hypothetical protein
MRWPGHLWRVLLVVIGTAFPLWSQVAILTERYDSFRTGANLGETVLNTSNVTADQFGLLYSYTVDGSIQAQPLYVPNLTIPGLGTFNVLFVVTMNDVIYAFNADSNSPKGGILWSKDLRNPTAGITPIPITDVVGVNNLNIVGNVGIESTPVIDLASNTMYLVARTKEVSGSTTSYVARLHAVDITSGSEKFGGPVSVGGSVPGTGQGSSNGSLPFDPFIQNQRSSLALVNGTIVFAWASHEDDFNFHGWIFAFNAQTLQQTGVYCSTPDGKEGGIWMAGRAPVVDASGNVYYASGNGDWDGNTNFGDSVLKLSTTNGKLSLVDYFTPDSFAMLGADDFDLGSSGPLLIPGTDLLLHTGKDSIIRVMHTSNMGHEQSGNGQIVQNFPTTGEQVRGGMVFWNRATGLGPTMYVWPDNSGLNAFRFNGTKFNTSPLTSAIVAASGNSGGVLTLSANGDTPGTGIVWSSMPLNANGDHGTVDGVLRAFDADDLSNELWDSEMNDTRDDMGVWPKYSPPTVVNGKVYMASFSNFLNVYGLLASTPDFTISATPSAQTVAPGGNTSYVLNVGAVNGFSGAVSFSVSGLPAGASGTFNPSSIKPGANSTLTVTTGTSTPAADTTLTITGTSGLLSHTATVTLSVTDFTIKASPSAQTIASGASTSYVVSVGAVNGFSGVVSLSVSGLPAGATGKFSPSSTGPGASSTLNVTTGPSTPAADATLTITGTSGPLSHAATVTLSVTDFTMKALPSAQTIASGGSTSYVLSAGAVNGFSGAVSLSVSGLPAGTSGAFSPSLIGPGTNSTLTVATSPSTPSGGTTLTMTGTSGALSHTTTVTLTVTGSAAGAPALSVSAAVVDFGSVIVNERSPSRAVNLSAANAAVSIQSVDVSSSAFVLSNQCGTDLAAGSQCSILVLFQPPTLGMLTGTMPIRDDAAGSPHVVQLQGQGSHFVFVPGTGSGQVIAAGRSANFSVGLQSLAGTNETVSVSCSVAPPPSACTLSQSSFALNGALQTLTVTVPTAARSGLLRWGAPIGPGPRIAVWFGVFATILLALAFLRPNSPVSSLSLRLGHVVSAAILIALATAMISCAGGTSVGAGGASQTGVGGAASQTSTPAGQYVVTITGTSSNSANPPQSMQLPFSVN